MVLDQNGFRPSDNAARPLDKSCSSLCGLAKGAAIDMKVKNNPLKVNTTLPDVWGQSGRPGECQRGSQKKTHRLLYWQQWNVHRLTASFPLHASSSSVKTGVWKSPKAGMRGLGARYAMSQPLLISVGEERTNMAASRRAQIRSIKKVLALDKWVWVEPVYKDCKWTQLHVFYVCSPS